MKVWSNLFIFFVFKKFRKSNLFILFLFLAFLFSFQPVNAISANNGLVPCGSGVIDSNGNTIECNFCHIFELANNIYKFVVFELVPIVSILMIAIGGFTILISGASKPDMYKKGMDIIKITVVALIIIYASWLVVQFVLGILTSGPDQTWYNPTTWNQFDC